jgi:tetratricopeptide (TPR) repeat protein
VHKGYAQRALKDYNASLKSYGRALEIDRNKTQAWSGMTEAYTALKDYDKAYSAAAKLTELAPTNKVYWLKEGNLLQMQGLYNESIVKYEGALTLDAEYKEALYREGISLMALGEDARAVILFDRLLNIAPNYKQAYYAKGLALENDKKYSQAVEAFDKALEIDPKRPCASG